MQSDNRPAVAWLEGLPRSASTCAGSTARPSPLRRRASSARPTPPPWRYQAASMRRASPLAPAMSGKVAFTYERGAYLALGSVGTGAAAAWTIGAPTFIGDPANDATPRARSPRIATGPGGAVVISYIRAAQRRGDERRAACVAQLRRRRAHSAAQRVARRCAQHRERQRDSQRTALALRSDGNPWVAWIEQPSSGAAPRLWLRGFDGVAWGAAVEVPTAGHAGRRLGPARWSSRRARSPCLAGRQPGPAQAEAPGPVELGAGRRSRTPATGAARST